MILNSSKVPIKELFNINLGFLFLLIIGFFITINSFTRNECNQNFQIIQNSEQINSDIFNALHRYDISQKVLNKTSNENTALTLYQPFIYIGFTRSFWILDFSSSSYYNINATLLSMGENCYVYMEDLCIAELGESAANEKTRYICEEFDNTIYHKVITLAGHPDGTLGDIDGDQKIIIVVSLNPISYYDQRNELNLDYSNMCEMFYIYYNTWIPTIAHEFYHLIWFNNEMDEPHYTLEALAEYSEFYTGYLAPYNNLTPQSKLFLGNPEDSLLYWNMLNSIDYGGVYLFAFYIAEHYGIEILQNLITEPTDGAYGIENVLHRAGFNITFNELYLNWITALSLDELGFESNIYGFKNLDAHVSKYTLITRSSFNNKIKLYYYGFNVHKFKFPSNEFTIEIRKNSDITIGLSIAFYDIFGWHIYKDLNNKGIRTITENISGSEIDELYLITSYIFDRTPPLPSENGLGPFTYIEIIIYDKILDLYISFLKILGSFTLILIIIIITTKRKHSLKNQNKKS
ncbi:MAG: hypothetical protein ACFFDF_15260 [Candidatus Odinarchaeota archaeon]